MSLTPTPKQLEVLRRVAQRKITGTFRDGVWTFRDDGVTCTSVVLALSAKGLASITHHNAIADVTLSERGQRRLAVHR